MSYRKAGTARYSSPTRASQSKSKDPTGIRGKVSEMDLALRHLHREVEAEQQKAEVIEKNASHQHDKMTAQVLALRKAFDQLADSVMEETEKIRKDVVDELRSTTNSTFSAIEKMQSHMHKSEEDRTNNQIKSQNVMRELKTHVEKLYQQQESMQSQLNLIHTQFTSHREESGKSMEYMRSQLKDFHTKFLSCQQISNQLKSETSATTVRCQGAVDELQQLQQKLSHLEDSNTNINHEMKQRLNDMESFTTTLNTHYQHLNDKILQLRHDTEGQITNSQKTVTNQLNLLEEELKQDSLTKSARNIDDAMSLVSKDLRALLERLNILEEGQGMLRRELMNQLVSVESSVDRKVDVLQTQYYQLCRDVQVKPTYQF